MLFYPFAIFPLCQMQHSMETGSVPGIAIAAIFPEKLLLLFVLTATVPESAARKPDP